jgi:hypothetical protein
MSYIDQRGPDQCWPWIKCASGSGYGQFWCGMRDTVATRIMYYIHYGLDPCEKLVLQLADIGPI